LYGLPGERVPGEREADFSGEPLHHCWWVVNHSRNISWIEFAYGLKPVRIGGSDLACSGVPVQVSALPCGSDPAVQVGRLSVSHMHDLPPLDETRCRHCLTRIHE